MSQKYPKGVIAFSRVKVEIIKLKNLDFEMKICGSKRVFKLRALSSNEYNDITTYL